MDPTSLKVLLSGSKKDDPLYVDDVFSTFLYEGNNGTQSINNGIDLAGEGGLVWIKDRTSGNYHCLFDTDRGVKKVLASDRTFAEQGPGNGNVDLYAFNNNGFNLGTTYNGYVNSTGQDYASWTFRKAPGFFDVVTYTGNNDSDRAIPHNLGSEPGMVIVKRTDGVNNWFVYHRSLSSPQTKWLSLNTNYAETQANPGVNMWGSMTSTHIGVRDYFALNSGGYNYVAYIFAHDDAQFGTNGDESIIKCGSYTGNGSTDGPEINLGFEAQWIMIRRTDSTSDWYMFDNMRGMFVGGDQAYFEANSSVSEPTARFHDITSTGWKIVKSWDINNASGGTYIYMAIRRPNKPPESATEVFDVSYRITGEPTVQTSFVVDAAIKATWNGTGASSDPTYHGWFSRLTGQYGLSSSSTNAQYDLGTNSGRFDYMNGWGGSDSASTFSQFYNFKRAPGFMDVVTYTGTNSAPRSLSHNLAVTPELLIVKKRSGSDNWLVAAPALGTIQDLHLNDSSPASNYTSFSAYSASTITLHSSTSINAFNGTYIAYLFATLPGISKVGSYSGTGYDVNVDCGFTAGPRFVMIKRTDVSGDWYLYDTLRGLTAGNDPYMFMNSNILQVTNTDYIDPLSTGFTITSSAPAALNASGGTYLFLAIA